MSEITNKDSSANPASLGLFGFGMSTVLLSMHTAGYFELNSMNLAMGLLYGGISQVIAGILESRKGNTFAMTAFMSYGFFWLTFVGLIVIPSLGWTVAASTPGMVAYLVMWGILTSLFFIGTLKFNRAMQFVFASAGVLFFLLAYGYSSGDAGVITFAGYEGIICGASATYLAAANLLNEVYDRTVLPVWPVS